VTTFRESPVTDAATHALVGAYFEYRAATWTAPSAYLPTFPDPAHFSWPHGVFLVAEFDGADSGCGGIRSLGDGRFEVKHLWVLPEAQGRGLGRALLEQLEARARALGGTELVLDTNASLAAAGRLYRSSGFVTIEPYNDNPNATHWFAKRL
jgi:GNAT superfamily N-acetyltransferase